MTMSTNFPFKPGDILARSGDGPGPRPEWTVLSVDPRQAHANPDQFWGIHSGDRTPHWFDKYCWNGEWVLLNPKPEDPLSALWGSVVMVSEEFAAGRKIEANWGSTVVIVPKGEDWSEALVHAKEIALAYHRKSS